MEFKRTAGICVLMVFGIFTCVSQLYAKADPYKDMAQELSNASSKLKNPKIAIMPFSYVDKRKSPGGEIVSERLTTRIVRIGKYNVIERALLQNVLSELHLEATGVVDVETALTQMIAD